MANLKSSINSGHKRDYERNVDALFLRYKENLSQELAGYAIDEIPILVKQKYDHLKRVILRQPFDMAEGFVFVSEDEQARIQFYKHLSLIRSNKLANYSFMTRGPISKVTVGVLDGAIIPEVYAGAAHRFYHYLKDCIKNLSPSKDTVNFSYRKYIALKFYYLKIEVPRNDGLRNALLKQHGISFQGNTRSIYTYYNGYCKEHNRIFKAESQVILKRQTKLFEALIRDISEPKVLVKVKSDFKIFLAKNK